MTAWLSTACAATGKVTCTKAYYTCPTFNNLSGVQKAGKDMSDPKPPLHWRSYGLAILLAILLFGTVIGYKRYVAYVVNSMLAGRPATAVPVTAYTVTSQSWQPRLNAIGFIEPVQGVTLSVAEAGIVSRIHFQSGEQAQQGKLLVELDSSVEQSNLEASVAQQTTVQHTLERTRQLFRKHNASQADLDTAVSAHQSLQARIASLKATINRRKIVAPFNGTLGLRNIHAGQYLHPGDDVTVLEDYSTMRLNLSIPQNRIRDVYTGMPVEITTSAYPDHIFHGTVQAINPTVEGDSGVIRLQAIIPNPDNLLRAGMYASASLLQQPLANAIVIPQPAISFSLYGQMVYSIIKDHDQLKVEQKQVTVADNNGRMALITKGLKAGEQIVVTGQVHLNNQTPVYLVAHDGLDKDLPVPRN